MGIRSRVWWGRREWSGVRKGPMGMGK